MQRIISLVFHSHVSTLLKRSASISWLAICLSSLAIFISRLFICLFELLGIRAIYMFWGKKRLLPAPQKYFQCFSQLLAYLSSSNTSIMLRSNTIKSFFLHTVYIILWLVFLHTTYLCGSSKFWGEEELVPSHYWLMFHCMNTPQFIHAF